MACIIAFSLRDSVADLENPSHPSHDAWYKALTLLRQLGMEKPGAQYGDMSEYSYCCVNEENPQRIIYLYPQCTDNHVKSIEANCNSKRSKLSRLVSPLLQSSLSVSRLMEPLDLFPPTPGPERAIKYLEFLTLHGMERPMVLYSFLEPYRIVGSQSNSAFLPVRSFSSVQLENNSAFYCIEWKSLEDRADMFSSSALRRQLKSVHTDHRAPFLQALGKTEEEVTWEEDLDIFFGSTGAHRIERKFFRAQFMSDKYLGLDARSERGCVIL